MTTLDYPKPFAREPLRPEEDNYLTHTRGALSWLLTLDHKRIGIMYLLSTMTAFLLGGIGALLVRTELIWPGETIMNQDQYNRAFTLHGAIMVFLVIIPSIPAALGNFVLPIMLGAKDVAFPRINLMSYWLWVAGAIFAVYAIAGPGLDTGWTFYTPYSIRGDGAMAGTTWALFGVFILGFSSIFTGMNFLVTIHRLRPPGMTWFRMPLFLWALYATAVIQVMATPVLAITLCLLMFERSFGIGIFNPELGGDPVLYQHFFWFYSHPAVYIMILPGMGIVSELIAVHSHKHIFGYRFIAFSSVAIAVFGFLVWGHHMFPAGQSPLMNVIFSAITFSVSIPSAIKVFNWLATMYRGSISYNTPMLYGMAFIFIFTIGGLTGLHLGTLATDIHLHDTYFVVAHFHYVMLGSIVFAFIGGLHHWWPKITGKMYRENVSLWATWIILIGFNITFFTQFMMGSKGMPRRYWDYTFADFPQTTHLYHIYHFISSIGSYVMAIGFFLTAYNLIHSMFRGARAPMNPWGGKSLEWQCPSPPPHDNFPVTPKVGDCYDFSEVEWDPKQNGYVVLHEGETAGARGGH
ncbi:MAG: cbb3-type cytochrome c oxidase subunit I [Phycisphaerales bacterium]|nr:cbb3-type cytochrome c oxidase subunit I [Phycisphaerales bacterium]MCI0632034.1 cbb3-type cytochrome c oxidase subunit I [Phycisphaerales bacterium]